MSIFSDFFRGLVRGITAWAWRREIDLCESITRIRSLHANDRAMEMEIEQYPAIAQWAAKCFASIVAQSPNYTEMRFEMFEKYAGQGGWITVLIKKGEGKTPHELRVIAEAERDALRKELQELRREHVG